MAQMSGETIRILANSAESSTSSGVQTVDAGQTKVNGQNLECQLQRLKGTHRPVYCAYRWFQKNRDQFSGQLWLPCLHLEFDDESSADRVRQALGIRDFYTFVAENFCDMDRFLNEMKKRGIRIGCGLVPSAEDEVEMSDVRGLMRLFEAPSGLKRYVERLVCEPASGPWTPEPEPFSRPSTSQSWHSLDELNLCSSSSSDIEVGHEQATVDNMPIPVHCRDQRSPVQLVIGANEAASSVDHVTSSQTVPTQPVPMAGTADFGEAVLMKGRTINTPALIYACRDQSGFYFVFRRSAITRRKDGKETNNFRCSGCEKISDKGPVGTTAVRDGRLVKDPAIDHKKDCVALTRAEVEALRISREMKASCRQGTRPMQAYTVAMVDTIASSPDDATLAHDVQDNIGPYHKNRRSLYRHTTKRFIPIPDINNLPIEYQVTLETRLRLDDGESLDQEKLLLFSSSKFLIFASIANLRGLHQSEYWICDGTFELCPKPYTQLYTIHGFVNGEGLPFCHALMPDRTQQSYQTLFQKLKDAIVENFGVLGVLHTVMMDFEKPARAAVLEVLQFESVAVRGCLFHMGQCLDRALTKRKLKQLYVAGGKNPDGNDVPAQFYRWVRAIKSSSFFPPQLVNLLWLRKMSCPSILNMANVETAYRIQEFISYVENTWMRDVQLWNHFENEWRVCERLRGWPGPRTTNLAEGWHNKLNFDFGHPHPALNTFLDCLQQSHQLVEIRERQLFTGCPPKPRDTRYASIDRQLAEAKCKLLTLLPDDLNSVEINDYWPEPIRRHLRRISFLIGPAASEDEQNSRPY